jgi:hypothetical protein
VIESNAADPLARFRITGNPPAFDLNPHSVATIMANSIVPSLAHISELEV